jgi:uncharacterized protein YlxP (DUF503 family)
VKIGVLLLHLSFPICTSLKDKRSRLKPLLARLPREFNISVAEIDYQDTWQSALVACAQVSNDYKYVQRALQKIPYWIEKHYPDVAIVDFQIELI